MTRYLFALFGALLITSVIGWHAYAAADDPIYIEALPQTVGIPSSESRAFIAQAVSRYTGISISGETVLAAIRNDRWTVCKAVSEIQACDSLYNAIMDMVNHELEVEDLGNNLVMATNGSELVVADEIHRPLSIGHATLLSTAIWTNTGSRMLPWPYDDPALEMAFSDLVKNSGGEMAVMRFHYGLFRMLGEEAVNGYKPEKGFETFGKETEKHLRRIATLLEIDYQKNTKKKDLKEWATPIETYCYNKTAGCAAKQKMPNVALWAREDDIGLHFIYPMRHPRFNIDFPEEEYPKHYFLENPPPEGMDDILSYPWRYDKDADLPVLVEGLTTPVCQRVSGREGYLCKPVEDPEVNCPYAEIGSGSSTSGPCYYVPVWCEDEYNCNALGTCGGEGCPIGQRCGFVSNPQDRSAWCGCVDDSSSSSSEPTIIEQGLIHIFTCDETERVIPQSPEVCSGSIAGLFELNHPDENPKDPNAPMTATGRVCVPRTITAFPGSLVTNACYIGWCVKESLSGHTLLGNRNSVTIAESVSPYEACMRDDPQIGLVSELSPTSTPALPQYIGHYLVREFDKEYCLQSGQIARHGAVAGACAFRNERRLKLPLQTFVATSIDAQLQNLAVQVAQRNLDESAYTIGQRSIMEQSLPLYRSIGKAIALPIHAIANLFIELEKSPVTTTACPWNGKLDFKDCGTLPASSASGN